MRSRIRAKIANAPSLRAVKVEPIAEDGIPMGHVPCGIDGCQRHKPKSARSCWRHELKTAEMIALENRIRGEKSGVARREASRRMPTGGSIPGLESISTGAGSPGTSERSGRA